MVKKVLHFILVGTVFMLSIATLIFMMLKYSIEISTALSNPEMGMELLLNRIKLMAIPIFLMLFFWFLINYIANKIKKSKQ